MSVPSPAMQALLDAAGGTGFALHVCRECAHRFYPPQAFCPRCLSGVVKAAPASGRARVLSTSLIHKSVEPEFASRLPLHVACVQLDEGPSLFCMTAGSLAPGTLVTLRVRDGVIHADVD